MWRGSATRTSASVLVSSPSCAARSAAVVSSHQPAMIPLRRLSDVRAAGDLVWFQPALDRLRALRQETDPRLRQFFTGESPCYIARAPGRLDVMGGIADYSGARVLELPLELPSLVEPGGALSTAAALAAWFAGREPDRWAGYVVGIVQSCLGRAAREGRGAPAGLRLLIDSTVPEGRGVASSAALEVAAGAVVAASCGSPMTATELAAACQAVENHVVGAPCGIMDQMTSACGRRDRLLRLRCQPGTIEGYVEIPSGYRFYGIDSGISHAVSGADYGTVRTAAFMGLRILTTETSWRGRYLADLTPAEFSQVARALPEEMNGAEFLERYGGISDTATAVHPDRRYPVRRASEHPVGEQARVDRFAEL